jgi:hypothetical protein
MATSLDSRTAASIRGENPSRKSLQCYVVCMFVERDESMGCAHTMMPT